jgi:thiol-disulfide isomerase/thioredoxin
VSAMGETGPEKKAGGSGVKLAIVGVVAVASVAALYVIGSQVFKQPEPPASAPATAADAAADGIPKPPEPTGAFAGLAVGHMKRLTTESAGKPAPAISFVDASGKALTLADFKGQPVLVNLWATWCAPCKKEMPTLAALQKAYEGKVKVVALSIDKEGQTAEAKAFIAENAPLAFYQDAAMKAPFAFDPPAQGFPTTIFYGADGIERARLVAEADWSSKEARAVVDRLVAN